MSCSGQSTVPQDLFSHGIGSSRLVAVHPGLAKRTGVVRSSGPSAWWSGGYADGAVGADGGASPAFSRGGGSRLVQLVS